MRADLGRDRLTDPATRAGRRRNADEAGGERLAALTAGLAETVALAQSLGLEGQGFLDVIEGGPVDAPYAQLKGKMMLERSFAPSFPLEHAAKDARLVLEAGQAAGAELEVAHAVAGRFTQAMHEGAAHEDIAAVYDAGRSS